MVKFPTLGKQKPNFATGSTPTKENIGQSKIDNQKVPQKCFTLTIVSMTTKKLMIEIALFLNNVKHLSS